MGVSTPSRGMPNAVGSCPRFLTPLPTCLCPAYQTALSEPLGSPLFRADPRGFDVWKFLAQLPGSHALHRLWCQNVVADGPFPVLKIYDGAYHQLLNEPNRDEVINDIISFVLSGI